MGALGRFLILAIHAHDVAVLNRIELIPSKEGGAIDTKNHIADVFLELTKAEDARAVSVRRICKAGNISKTTFYYHFEDREDLMRWTFHRGFAKKLLRQFPYAVLIYPQNKKYCQFPFYINLRNETDDLNFGDFWRCLSSFFEEEAPLIRFSMRTSSTKSLKDYLYEVYRHELRMDFTYLCIKRNAQPEEAELDWLSSYFTNAVLGCYFDSSLERLIRGKVSGPWFCNITHELMRSTVSHISNGIPASYPENRPRH